MNKLEEIIRKELNKTEKLIEEYKELTQPVEPDCAIGRVSRMDAINNKSIIEASLRQAEAKLKNLLIVRSNLGKKEFGRCKKCGREIPLRRIMIKPDSLFCVDCAK